MSLRAAILRQTYWLTDFLKGRHVRRMFNEIKFLSEKSYDEGYAYRCQKLQNILMHAIGNTDFYKSIKPNDGGGICLQDFPVVNKSILIQNYNRLRVDVENIPGQDGHPLHIQSTSGSTGIPFRIPQDRLKRLRRIAELKYFGEVVGFRSHEKLIQLRTWNKWQKKSNRQSRRENIIPFDIKDMGNARMQELCSIIEKEKAVCVRSYASSMQVFANYLKDNPHKFKSLKIAIAGSEALTDDTRENIKKYIGCEIISQYADEECGILAQEKIPTKETDNPMYLNHADYFFEILKFDSDEAAGYGEMGRIVVTDLHNYAFLMIRYDTGDVGILGEADEYSNGYPVLTKLYGRRMDLIFSPAGNALSPMIIGRTLKHFSSVAQWQFVQEDRDRYVLKVSVSDKERFTNDSDAIISSLKESIGEDALITIQEVDEIPVLSSGKRKPVVNNWKSI